MPFCRKCGSHVSENDVRCPSCGAKQEKSNSSDFKERIIDGYKKVKNDNDRTYEYDAGDIMQNKIFAMLSYIGLAILVPFFLARNSRFVRFHLNQALILIITEVILGVLIGVFVRSFLLSGIVELVLLAARIFGVVNAITGKAIEIPFVGKLRIIK